MKPEIRKIVTGSTLFFGILAVSTAGMQLAAWRNAQNAPDSVFASVAQAFFTKQAVRATPHKAFGRSLCGAHYQSSRSDNFFNRLKPANPHAGFAGLFERCAASVCVSPLSC